MFARDKRARGEYDMMRKESKNNEIIVKKAIEHQRLFCKFIRS